MTDTVPATVPAPERAPGAVTVRQPQRDLMQFGTIAEVIKFAELVQHAEGMIPKHMIGKPGKIAATVMAGHELGVGPMASLRAFHVVEGKPTADYSFWVARLKAAGYRLKWLEKSPERVSLQLIGPDGSESAPEVWDKARAVTAGLWGKAGPWKNHPQTMLSARAVTSAGRAFAAEVMFGCYETDEADEIVRDAEVTRIDGVPAGTVTERVAAAAGSTISDEAKAIEARAKECADMAKALGLTRDQVFAMMTELGIKPGRMSELPREDLDRLAERLDAEAASRGDRGPQDPESTGGDGGAP